MTEDEQPSVSGVVVDDDEEPRSGNGFAMKVPLQMPPGIQGMNLGTALLNQTRYWGYRRAINAYRKAVEDKTAMVQAVSSFYRGIADMDESKVRWEHRTEARETTRQKILAELDDSHTDRNHAKARRIESELVVEAAEQKRKSNEILLLINQYNLEAEQMTAERNKLDAARELAAARNGRGESIFQKKLRAVEDAKRDYDEMMAAKAEHVKEYGGEDKMPAYLRTLYQNLEEDLAFRGE